MLLVNTVCNRSLAKICCLACWTALVGLAPDASAAADKATAATVTNPVGSARFITGRVVAFGITTAVRDQPQAPTVKDAIREEKAENNRVKYPLAGAGAGRGDGLFIDPLLALNRAVDAPQAMPGPSLTFNGMTAAEACPCLPPDTNGDVGPNHFMQATNVRISVYDKAGTRLLGPNLQSNTFFNGLPAGNACRTTDDGDPVVLYDSMADRWLISQFSVGSDPGHQCIAISQTGDPTGAYYAYDFVMPNSKFHDYPHYGVWPDGYYLTTNQFNQAGTAFQGAGIFAFDRAKMLAGDPGATFIYHDVAADDPNAGGMLPSDLDGFVPPPAGLPNRVMEFRSDEFGDPLDAIRSYELVPNFVNPGASTFTIRADLPLAAFDARSPNSRNVVEQIGGTALDVIADRLMFRLAYRNLGSFAAPSNSWTGNFSVNVSGVNPTSAGTYQSGVRWFELRSADSTSLPTVRDQGTQNLAPGNGASGINNWMAGIAQDSQGNIGLGYSASGTAQNANIVITGRTGAATGGGMNEGEAVFMAAGGAQSSTSGRWGDYSSMNVDPADECTFWYTQEYYAAASNGDWATRIGKFVFPGCAPLPKGFIAANVTNCGNGLPIAGATVTATGGFVQTTDASGNLLVNMGVAPGNYTVSATKFNFDTASAPASVSDGATATVNLCIVGTPAIASTNSTIATESFLPANNALDPGEVVTVNFCALNTGGADTVNLVGTLAATGGVTAPGAAQSFGVVQAGGLEVCQPFTFTVDPGLLCGDTVVATVAYADGANNFGNKTYSLRTGVPGAGSGTQTVSYAGAPVAVPDNVPAGVNLTVPVSGILGDLTDLNFTFDVGAGGACDATLGNANSAMDHTFIGDLAFKLTAPGGASAVIVNRRGGTRENICATTLDDEGGFPALSTVTSTGGQFLSGNFTPDSALSIFDGGNPNGTWTLNVSDNAGVDTGSMRRFSLVITNQTRECSAAVSDVLFKNGFE